MNKNIINKNYMKYIIKEVIKTNELIIKYIPTNEEKEYLKKYGITAEIITKEQMGLFSGYPVTYTYCKYIIDNIE